MFLPPVFRLDAPEAIAELIAAHSFALLVTAGPEGPEASHLPLLHRPDEGRLLGHLAAANPQSASLRRLAGSGGRALVVFSGPHAYVSPSLYRPGPAVPTWNYLSVQVSGPVALLGDAETAGLLDALTATYEAGRAEPWSTAGQDPAFLAKMRGNVLGFAIATERVEAKAKLSQNRAAADRAGVAAGLAAEPDPAARATADWMTRLGIA
ncbi:negative transcriptional regulator, PaiB family [Tistlia consotensis]|uniref:Negative transcriptional regulator, PaiB family n=1 Tax=Tistlia consotensis USBA 355 TaxID=560819 RepID=A0A1Y6CSK7_9PROT|nr:FMN-binding negative transcriptional regulator [Tistlia consotensis]SMF74925.1 negative transcriptional regulator, PaiB family [Tistlia consotensis USBA 355]SNS11469.1 negative transcriptional regulator, PaiB family [Tistlia consotensis]